MHIDLKIPPRPPGYAFVEVRFAILLSVFFFHSLEFLNPTFLDSLKSPVMLKMLYEGAMAMILMGIAYGLVLFVAVTFFLHSLAILMFVIFGFTG